jgi:hypothetical protein
VQCSQENGRHCRRMPAAHTRHVRISLAPKTGRSSVLPAYGCRNFHCERFKRRFEQPPPSTIETARCSARYHHRVQAHSGKQIESGDCDAGVSESPSRRNLLDGVTITSLSRYSRHFNCSTFNSWSIRSRWGSFGRNLRVQSHPPGLILAKFHLL